MEKNLLFFIFLLFISTSAFAQGINLKVKGVIVNSDTLYKSGVSTDVSIAQQVNVENTTGAPMDVQCRRYELDVVSGSTNFYCWFICYANTITGVNPHSVNSDFLTIPGGATVSNVFAGDHEPNGTTGESCYKYVWFDKANPNDSSWVDVCFNVGTLGLSEIQNSTQMDLFPNPASDQVTLKFNNSKGYRADKVQITNMLGAVVKSVDLENNSNGNVVVDVAELNNGVFFYTLIGEKGILGTKRLVISK